MPVKSYLVRKIADRRLTVMDWPFTESRPEYYRDSMGSPGQREKPTLIYQEITKENFKTVSQKEFKMCKGRSHRILAFFLEAILF